MFRFFLFSSAAFFFFASNASAEEVVEVRSPKEKRTLHNQVDRIPAEFKERFFNVPISVRIERNEQFLGDARIVVNVDESIELLDFIDISESPIAPKERQIWSSFLQRRRQLGACTEDCPLDLLMMHYSLENSVLSLVTKNAERDGVRPAYYEVLADGEPGAILHNAFNLINSRGRDFSGVYALDAHASLGKWSVISGFRAEQSATGRSPDLMRHFYLEQELSDSFVRTGYFYPDARGVLRQPGNLSGRDNVMLGFMLGSSDVLAVQESVPSLYPVTITASRQGIVEIYRNGRLLHTQPIQPGLQTLDTTRLPRGIYSVDVQVIEEGHVVARSVEQIYKPSDWSNPAQRWRYNVFMGRSDVSVRSGDTDTALVLGGSVNYLLHPRSVVALSAQQQASATTIGLAIDWSFAERSSAYASLSQSSQSLTSMDAQTVLGWQNTNLVFSHVQTWLDADAGADQRMDARFYQGPIAKSSMSIYQFLTPRTSFNLQLSYSRGLSQGVGLDFGMNHAQRIHGNDAQWRLSLFRRPEDAWRGSARALGVELALNFSFGKEGKSLSANFGSRSAAAGGQDQYAGLTYSQSIENSWLRSVSASASADRYGPNISAGGSFKQDYAHGNFYWQRAALNGALSTGLNLDSTIAVGGGKLAATGEYVTTNSAGVIVDVVTDLAQLKLRAEDSAGNSTLLKPGRNFVPVAPYRAGNLQFDLAYDEQNAVAIAPDMSSYQLNRGGVAYQQIHAMSIMAVLGRLVDGNGLPVKGARIVNHAGGSVSETDGYFTLNISQAEPILEVHRQGVLLCQLFIDKHQYQQEGDLLLLGDIPCISSIPTAMQPSLQREALS